MLGYEKSHLSLPEGLFLPPCFFSLPMQKRASVASVASVSVGTGSAFLSSRGWTSCASRAQATRSVWAISSVWPIYLPPHIGTIVVTSSRFAYRIRTDPKHPQTVPMRAVSERELSFDANMTITPLPSWLIWWFISKSCDFY